MLTRPSNNDEKAQNGETCGVEVGLHKGSSRRFRRAGVGRGGDDVVAEPCVKGPDGHAKEAGERYKGIVRIIQLILEKLL